MRNSCSVWAALALAGLCALAAVRCSAWVANGPCGKGVRDGEPPMCSIEYAPMAPQVGELVTFWAMVSDPDGFVVSWAWDFGDGNADLGDEVTHAYASGGTYTVTLIVTDETGLAGTCQAAVEVAATVQVEIPLTAGWHMIALPLKPVNKNILLDRETKVEDPESIFYTAWEQGNDPRNRLFRMEPSVGYWVYDPDLYPCESWYEIGVGAPAGVPPAYCDNETFPDPGPWWQGFWLLVEVPEGIVLSYTAYPMPVDPVVRFMDINKNYDAPTFTWAWMMTGVCARVPDPYTPDVTTWPLTSTVTDLKWGNSAPPTEPTTWLPTSHCAGADAWDQGYIGLPLIGHEPGGYYSVSPAPGEPYCGAPTLPFRDSLTPGEGYWLDVEDPEVWLRLLVGA